MAQRAGDNAAPSTEAPAIGDALDPNGSLARAENASSTVNMNNKREVLAEQSRLHPTQLTFRGMRSLQSVEFVGNQTCFQVPEIQLIPKNILSTAQRY